jgi:hypothetical protein
LWAPQQEGVLPPAGVHFSTFLLFIFLRFYVFGNKLTHPITEGLFIKLKGGLQRTLCRKAPVYSKQGLIS